MKTIDLRSDTVTRPTDGMRKAMMEAPVGDDVYGEDPSVNALQEEVADLLGKEAGLFVPSGVMGNQLALKVHTRPADEVLVERDSHILNYESGAPGLLSGVQLNVLDGERGLLLPHQVLDAVRAGYYWEAPTRLLCLENTVNKAGGVVYPLDRLQGVAEAAREKGLALHLDGARLWNAAAASGESESDYAALFDTVNVCFSKGLGAPVGSMLVGPADLIEEAHRYRKLFGGGMRQIGMLAEACRYALEHHRPRLAEDHEKAKRFAEGIEELEAVRVDPETVESNIVMFDVPGREATEVVAELGERGVRLSAFGPETIRVTTHLDVSMQEIGEAIEQVRMWAA